MNELNLDLTYPRGKMICHDNINVDLMIKLNPMTVMLSGLLFDEVIIDVVF